MEAILTEMTYKELLADIDRCKEIMRLHVEDVPTSKLKIAAIRRWAEIGKYLTKLLRTKLTM